MDKMLCGKIKIMIKLWIKCCVVRPRMFRFTWISFFGFIFIPLNRMNHFYLMNEPEIQYEKVIMKFKNMDILNSLQYGTGSVFFEHYFHIVEHYEGYYC